MRVRVDTSSCITVMYKNNTAIFILFNRYNDIVFKEWPPRAGEDYALSEKSLFYKLFNGALKSWR